MIGTLIESALEGKQLSLKEQTTLQETVQVLKGKSLTDLTLDNILVAQKDAILQLKYRNVSQAIAALNILKPLWDLYNYGYKYQEVLMDLEKYKESLE